MAAAKNVGFAWGFQVHNEEENPSSPYSFSGTEAIPESGHLVRDIAYGSNFVASHLVHLYQLAALDFVDPLSAGLDKPPFSPRFGPGTGAADYGYYYRIPTAMASPGTSTTYNLNVYVVAQYVLALTYRRMCNQIGGIWSGRAPFIQGLTPGGITTSVSQDAIDKTKVLLYAGGTLSPNVVVGGGSPAAPAPGTILAFIGGPLDFASFVGAGADPADLPIIGNGSQGGTMMFDTVAIATLYAEYFWLGNAYSRFLAYGVFEKGDPTNADNRLLTRGRKRSAQLGATRYVADQAKVYENVASSYYYDPASVWRHPWDGETEAEPRRRTTAYSWIKSPRYDDASDTGFPGDSSHRAVPHEVGPLARMVVNHDGVKGTLTGYYAGILYDAGYTHIPWGPFKGVKMPEYGDPGPPLDPFFSNMGGTWPNLGGAPYNLTYTGDSALDRYAARQLECWMVANKMPAWLNRLQTLLTADPDGPETSETRSRLQGDTFSPVYRSFGWTEAPRGALGHWMRFGGLAGKERITSYQCVVPSTWNASPRDAFNQPGPAEKAMENVYVRNLSYPLEIMRVSHSWDFCTACAVHLVKTNKRGKKIGEKVIKLEPTH